MSVSFYKHKIKYILVLFVSLNLALMPFSNTALSRSESPEVPHFQRGMCYTTWDRGSYAWSESERSIQDLKDMNVDHVQIVITQYQDKFNSTKIRQTQQTPNDQSVIKAIKYAHNAGLKVLLKPHIDLINAGEEGYWRGDIGFYKEEGWDKWFDSYEKFITHYAKIAEENGVELFCVGTELAFATQKTDRWRKIISSCRKIFSGDLVYAANWDNYQNVKFWDDLDYAGIDAYFPLSYKSDPGIDDLLSGWQKWLRDIRRWQSDVNKPVIFTEIGYPSSLHAPSEPWADGRGTPQLDLQASLYTAFFEAVGDSPWLAGVYWWDWSPYLNDGGLKNNHFTPRNKPAAKVLKEHFAMIGSRPVVMAKAPLEEKLTLEKILVEGNIPSINEILAEKMVPLDIRSTMNIGSPGIAMLSPPLFGDVFGKIETEIDLLPNIEKLTIKDGDEYRGEIVKGLPYGRGIMRYKRGDKYAGEFKNGLRDGTGIYFWKNGNIYIGEFLNGAQEGRGVFFWKNGSVYSGEFQNDLPNGIGTEIRDNGYRYEGEFRAGYLNGKGFVLKRNGDKYEGEFKNGVAHGKGVLTKKNGTVIKGEWSDGFQK
ncbi:MAG: hypothetical protein HQ594_03590 [Candidatus Omnitrophica bacterium]|nr:hypothetical protein [Candidatus Omnitrophota bacterium]